MRKLSFIGGMLLVASAWGCASESAAGPVSAGAGRCLYVNPFSNSEECKEYLGTGWDETSARADCDDVFVRTVGTFEAGLACDVTPFLGTCTVESGQPLHAVTHFTGTPELCSTVAGACRGFARGTFEDGPICGGDLEPGGGNGLMGPDPGELQPEGITAMTSDARVTVAPACNDETCIREFEVDGTFITFTPTDRAPTTGLIFYPGGAIDPRAYAPAARAFAEAGILAVLVPMPDGLAFAGFDRATAVMEAHPEITNWVIGGHSLGGVAAAKYLYDNPGAADGLFLWAAYPDAIDDLSEQALEVVSVYGTLDPLASVESISNAAELLPENTLYAPIVGGNHSYFCWHGLKEDDVEAALFDQAEQFDLAVDATIHLVHRVQAVTPPAIHPDFTLAREQDELNGCRAAQRQVAGFDTAQLPDASINSTHRTVFRDFWSFEQSGPSVLSGPSLEIFQYIRQVGNRDDLYAPPILNGELLCKLNSQESIVAVTGMSPSDMQGQCAARNRAAIAWATERLSESQRTRVADWNVRYMDDVSYPTGPDFMSSETAQVDVALDSAAQTLTLTARSFFSPLDAEGDAAGKHYCRALSLERALAVVHSMAR